MPKTILTAAEVEAMRDEYAVPPDAEAYLTDEERQITDALARLAASHLALLREFEVLDTVHRSLE